MNSNTSSSSSIASSIQRVEDSEDDIVLHTITSDSPPLLVLSSLHEEEIKPIFRHVGTSTFNQYRLDECRMNHTYPLEIKSPVFVALKPVLTEEKEEIASPLSPSSYLVASMDVPIKSLDAFTCVNPSFTSYETPNKIISTLESALDSLRDSIGCEYQLNQWSINVQCLVVAEVISFTINLSQLQTKTTASTEYEIEFMHRLGETLVFNELCDCIRSACVDIDAHANTNGFLFPSTLDPWLDARQELTGRKYAIKDREAMNLIEELNCNDLHLDTLYEVAKSIKNHSRHKGNRKLFIYDADRKKKLLKGLQWMLSDTEDLARFALFVLLQYAYDVAETNPLFTTPIEKSSFALLLNELKREEKSSFTSTMIENVLVSPLFVV